MNIFFMSYIKIKKVSFIETLELKMLQNQCNVKVYNQGKL